MKKRNDTRGFTLVEIAIVLVIIGLLLGGILKGQELINNAKVRAIADRQNSIKVAWFGFLDRYQGIPGDFSRAEQFIRGVTNGNGDGILATIAANTAITTDDVSTADESLNAFNHLTAAGFLRCAQCNGVTKGKSITPSNTLQNSYGGTMALLHTQAFTILDSTGLNIIAADQPRLAVLSGGNLPSNIISEVDRKVDDGNPFSGDMVFSQAKTTGVSSSPSASAADDNDCASINTTSGIQSWNNGQNFAIQPNCGVAVFI